MNSWLLRADPPPLRSLFVGSLVGLEAVGQYAGLELKGLSNVAAQSEDLLLTVDECAIKYESVIQIDPLARLAIGVGQLCLAIDAHNRRQRDNPPAAPVVTAVPAPTQTATQTEVGKRVANINAAEFQVAKHTQWIHPKRTNISWSLWSRRS